MESMILILGWLGIYSPLALGSIGSMIGCTRGGQAAAGAMMDTETGHGRFVGVAVMPSSQTIYGIVVTLSLNRELTATNSPGVFALGVLSGVALLVSASAQGSACAAAIAASKNRPEIFGLSIAPSAVVEGFAVFAFVFALVLAAGIPG